MMQALKTTALSRTLAEIHCGEDETCQFKQDLHNGDSLASEMVAFANSEGGTIIIGIADDGSAPGLTKGLLPYRGLGSGVPRALESWPRIDFRDDREGCLFVATVRRDEQAVVAEGSEKNSEKTREKARERVLRLIRANPGITTAELAEAAALTAKGIEWNIRRLKAEGRLRRIGPDRGGR